MSRRCVNEAVIASPEGATATVVLNSFTEIGLERIVGKKDRVGQCLARVRAERACAGRAARPGRARAEDRVVVVTIQDARSSTAATS